MTYVDGFVLPVPEGKLEAYKEMAAMAGQVWMKHGALAYKECVIEDAAPTLPEGAPPNFKMRTFHDLAGTKAGESVIFAFITYPSREARDSINAKVHEDMAAMGGCDGGNFEMPFDPARMAYGGFKAFVDL